MSDTLVAKSNAQPASLLFAESSPENESIHFSFQRKGDKPLNLRIPARQISAMITNLEGVRAVMEEMGVECGRGELLVPAAPFDFFGG